MLNSNLHRKTSYHNIRSYKLLNFMSNWSIAGLPVCVCGCSNGCLTDNIFPASQKEKREKLNLATLHIMPYPPLILVMLLPITSQI